MPSRSPNRAIRAAIVAITSAAALFAAMPPSGADAVEQTVVLATPVAMTAPAHVLPATANSAPASSTATTSAALSTSALNNALSKIGAPYRWGAAGPSAFDCSGLVNWAYRKAGVPLPRTSRAMSKVGTPVARNNLRPGDLVFFFRPVSHVAMYVGDGKIVYASTSGKPVKIGKLNSMPFNSARRL